MTKNIDFVIFDCDGTLVDSEPITTGIISEMMEEIGISISKKECHDRFVGTKFVDIANYIADQGKTIDSKAFEKNYRSRCDIVFMENLDPIEGVIDILESLTIPYCIASNGPKEKMDVTLRASGLNKYFPLSHIFSAYDVQKWKPDPTLFIHAAQSHEFHPEKSLVIEDTIHGIKAALAGGLPVIGVNIKSELAEVTQLGVPTFKNMLDVKKYLETELNLI